MPKWLSDLFSGETEMDYVVSILEQQARINHQCRAVIKELQNFTKEQDEKIKSLSERVERLEKKNA